MKNLKLSLLLLGLSTGLMPNAEAGERTAWTIGHGDLAINYSGGQFMPKIEELTPSALEPSAVEIRLNNLAKMTIPASATFSFLGIPGDPIWVIPQTENTMIPWMGFNAENTANGIFVGDEFNVRITGVQGPGNIFLWTTGTGTVDLKVNSKDGLDASDSLRFGSGGHFHENIGFDRPGTYFVSFQPSGDLQAGGTATGAEFTCRFEVNALKDGEIDLEVLYENGEWELALFNEAKMSELEADEAALHAVPGSFGPVPHGSGFEFLSHLTKGAYILPQAEQEGVLFLGIAGDEISAGVFTNEEVSLELTGVDGPGQMFLYSVSAFNEPTVYFNSADGISSNDRFPLGVGGHAHQNWLFSEPGIYRVSVKASGNLVAGGPSSSDVVELLFEVLAPETLGSGEIDMEVLYEDGEWELALLDEALEREICVDEALLRAAPASLETALGGAFAFLGENGSPIYILPQDEKEGVLFLGLAGDEIQTGVFMGDTVDLSLVGAQGPGDVFLYTVDGFGDPTVHFNSADGLSGADVFNLAVGGHVHQNLAFTQPGLYVLSLQASGTLVSGAQPTSSDIQKVRVWVQAPEVFSEGELDLEVVYEDSEWEIALLDEENEREVEVADALLKAGFQSEIPVPNDPAFAFLGSPGTPVWVLPQDEQEGLLYLGIAGDEIPGGTFNGESVDLILEGVRGPGQVSLFSLDSFGAPTVHFDSGDGIDGMDRFSVAVGGHSHQAWGFTAPGLYKVAVKAEGTLTAGSMLSASETVELTFIVEAREVFETGELDIEVLYDNGEFELEILDEEGMRELETDEVVLRARPAALEPVPAGMDFQFLGMAGGRIHILPQNENEGLLFLGIAGDELTGGVFDSDTVQLELVDVKGDGDVFLYSVDTLGSSTVYFDSSNGIDGSDVFPVAVGAHSHQNFAFSGTGIFEVRVRVTGSLVAGGQVSSEPVTLLFDIQAPRIFNTGELDLEVVFDEAFEIEFLEEETETEHEPSGVLLQGLPSARNTVPMATEFSFLGSPGDPVWILPQSEVDGLLFLGIAGDELPTSFFQGESVNLKLVGVRGPGDVFLYTEDTFGAPNAPFFNSADGIDGLDVFSVDVGSHGHANWAFSAPGIYKVQVQAEGVKTSDSQTVTGEVVELTFELLDFRLSSYKKDTNTLTIVFSSTANHMYQVQETTTLPGMWQNHGAPFSGSGEMTQVDVSISADMLKVFRVVDQGPVIAVE